MQVKYKVFRKDESRFFGPYILGGTGEFREPKIKGDDLVYLLFSGFHDDLKQELYAGDLVVVDCENVNRGTGEIVLGRGVWQVVVRGGVTDSVSLKDVKHLQRVGSIYDRKATSNEAAKI